MTTRYIAPAKARRLARQEQTRNARLGSYETALKNIAGAVDAVKVPNGTTKKIGRIATDALGA